MKSVGFRIKDGDSPADVLIVLFAADIAGTPLTVSVSGNDFETASDNVGRCKTVENASQRADGRCVYE